MKFIVNRLKEPSSWAGLSAIALAFGVAPDLVNVVAQAGVGIAGLVAFVMSEGA